MIRKYSSVAAIVLLAAWSQANAQDNGSILDFIDSRYESTADLTRTLWKFAEVGYQEIRSSTLLQ